MVPSFITSRFFRPFATTGRLNQPGWQAPYYADKTRLAAEGRGGETWKLLYRELIQSSPDARSATRGSGIHGVLSSPEGRSLVPLAEGLASVRNTLFRLPEDAMELYDAYDNLTRDMGNLFRSMVHTFSIEVDQEESSSALRIRGLDLLPAILGDLFEAAERATTVALNWMVGALTLDELSRLLVTYHETLVLGYIEGRALLLRADSNLEALLPPISDMAFRIVTRPMVVRRPGGRGLKPWPLNRMMHQLVEFADSVMQGKRPPFTRIELMRVLAPNYRGGDGSLHASFFNQLRGPLKRNNPELYRVFEYAWRKALGQ